MYRHTVSRPMVVLEGWRHSHLKHGGSLFDCRACWGDRPPPVRWTPSQDFGLVVTDGTRVVERSAIVTRLLVP